MEDGKEQNSIFHANHLRLHRNMNGPDVFFVTKCLKNRINNSLDSNSLIYENFNQETNSCADIIIDTLCHMAEIGKIRLVAFVVMPDHWHALFGVGKVRDREVAPTLNESPHLPSVMKSMCNWISRLCNKHIELNWQAGYYETKIKSGKQFSYVCNYIESNPTRQDLVEQKNLYKWSSTNEDFKRFLTRPWPWQFEK